MSQAIFLFLVFYFVVFLFVGVVWRILILQNKAGVNALKLTNKNGAERITLNYFLIIPALDVVALLLAAFFPEVYQRVGAVHLLNGTFFTAAGILIMIMSLVVVIVAQRQMGTSWRIGIDDENKTSLVEKGLFKYSRNPIFTAMIAVGLGYFLVLPHAITLAMLFLTIALIQVQVSVEEEHLKNAFKESYLDYMGRVRRWI